MSAIPIDPELWRKTRKRSLRLLKAQNKRAA
jgi:hypothetical protein